MAQLDERKLNEKLLVGGDAVVEVGSVAEIHGAVKELRRAILRLKGHGVAHVVGGFQQAYCLWVFRHHKVAEMTGGPLMKNCESKPLSRISLYIRRASCTFPLRKASTRRV